MKVAFITSHTFSKPGGVKRHILGLHREFQRRGIESKIIVPRRNWREKYQNSVILLGTSFPLRVAGTQADFCVNFDHFAIERVLKREKFDVLHFHNFGTLSAVQILERSKCLNIMTLHANLEKSGFLKTFPGFIGLVAKIIKWRMDGIIGVAPFHLNVLRKYHGPKAIIPNGIDLAEFNPRVPKIRKFDDGKINILFLGRIEERKGLLYLLKAFKAVRRDFPNTRLIVVGDGPLKNECRQWAEKNKLGEVVFEGEAVEEKIPNYYASCDIYCSPAIFGESFGIVLIEAMAVGKPVVAFANSGYKGLLGKGKGKKFLVKNRSHKDLARALESLIKNDGLRKEMGQWGIKEAKKYAWPKIADQILDFYKTCVKKKARF